MVQFTTGPNGYDINDVFTAVNPPPTTQLTVLTETGSLIVLQYSTGEIFDLSGAFDYLGDGSLDPNSLVSGVTLLTSGGTLEFSLTGINQTFNQLNNLSSTKDFFAGNDTLTGGAGNDVLAGFAGNNTLDGGGGTNTLDYSEAPAGVTVNFATGTAANGFGGTDNFIRFQIFVGSAFDDIFIGGPGSHTIEGGGGTDTLDYSAAPAGITANLATGAIINGFGGTDSVSNIATVKGGASNDTFIGGSSPVTFVGGAGNNLYLGGSGHVTLDYSAAPSGITADLATDTVANGYGGGDNFSKIAAITGSAFNDTFIPGAGSFTLDGGGGTNTLDYSGTTAPLAVTLDGGFGSLTVADSLGGSFALDNIGTIAGGAGDDVFAVGGTFWQDAVSVDGGGGDNTLDWSAAATIMTLNLATDQLAPSSNVAGMPFADFATFKGTGDDTIIGGPGNHVLETGSDGVDTVDYSAAPGAVTANFANGVVANGFGGVDQFETNNADNPSGIRILTTGAGDDTFIGGPGYRSLDGGAGFNTLDFSSESGGVTGNMTTTGGNLFFAEFGTQGYGESDRFNNISLVMGSSFNDTFEDDGTTPIMFEGGGGNDSITGAAVTAVFTGSYSDYTIDFLANKAITVSDNRSGSPDGTDTLTDVSRLAFADTALVATYSPNSSGSSYMWRLEAWPASGDISPLVQAMAGVPTSNSGPLDAPVHVWSVDHLAPPPVAITPPSQNPHGPA